MMAARPRPTVLPTMEFAAPVWTTGLEEVADAAPDAAVDGLMTEEVMVFWPVTVAVTLPKAGGAGGASAEL